MTHLSSPVGLGVGVEMGEPMPVVLMSEAVSAGLCGW